MHYHCIAIGTHESCKLLLHNNDYTDCFASIKKTEGGITAYLK